MSTSEINDLLARLPEWALLLAAGLSLLGSAWTAWHTTRGTAKGAARAYRWLRPVRPLSPLCLRVLEALDHPRPRLVGGCRLEAGGVAVETKYTLDWRPGETDLAMLFCGKASTENVANLLPEREQKRVAAKARQVYRRVSEQDAELKAAHALAALKVATDDVPDHCWN